MIKDDKVKLFDYKLEEIKSVSIVSFLEDLGYKMEKRGNHFVTNSPFSEDSNPSFRIYPENNFYDFSSGQGGTILDLVMNLYDCTFTDALDIIGGKFSTLPRVDKSKTTKKPIEKKKFNLETYYCRSEQNREEAKKYMESRKITPDECAPGTYFVKNVDEWKANLSIMFYHRDEFGNVCGAKFRNVREEDKSDQRNASRWSSRGRLFYYVLEHITNTMGEPKIFVTESETSSNSLYNYFRSRRYKNFVILCFGGVTSFPNSLPIKYQWSSDRWLIIDYDGDEKKYYERVERLSYLNCKDIKLALPKGEDVNSLWCKGEMDRYNNLFDKVF